MSSIRPFVDLLEPTELYNILNQSFRFTSLSDTSYLLLIDARETHEYNESHIITAKKAPQDSQKELSVPLDAELECKQHVVVYDGTTSSLEHSDTPAYKCAKLLADAGSRNPVLILKGGYESFSALYPFLRTQKIIWLPQELDSLKPYPTEIVPGFLYMGTYDQASAAYIQKDLKIKAHVNCSEKEDQIFEEGLQLLSIPINDSSEVDVKHHLDTACAFIDTHKDKKEPVLVYSDQGISRSALVCIAYLIHSRRESLEVSYDAVRKCNIYACPNTSFLEQLNQWHSENIKLLNEQ